MRLIEITRNPGTVFLVDAFGAVVSSFMLGYVLIRFQPQIGLPPLALYTLAAVASTYALYSFACGLLLTKNFRPFLALLIAANASYVGLTLVLLTRFQSEVTPTGFTYFAIEFAVIAGVIALEAKAFLRLPA